MKKWLCRILLCLILVFTIWAGLLYSCAIGNKKYNVVIESVKQGRYYMGSGVVISSDGLILTAGHVIEDADRLRITLSGSRVFDVNDYYVNDGNDIGLIKLPVDVNDYAALWDSNCITPNSIIYNIGNAKGIWDNSIFFGIIHNIKFKRLFLGENCEFILARMRIYPGCSGGGVYYWNKLIGITVKGGIGVVVIVPSNVCKKIIEDYQNASN